MKYLYHIMFGLSLAMILVVAYHWFQTTGYGWPENKGLYLLSIVALCNLFTFSRLLWQNLRSGNGKTNKV